MFRLSSKELRQFAFYKVLLTNCRILTYFEKMPGWSFHQIKVKILEFKDTEMKVADLQKLKRKP